MLQIDIIKRDMVGPVLVSTIHLSYSLATGEEREAYYETMIFGGTYDQDQARFDSPIDALLHHEAMIRKIQEVTSC